MRVTNYTVLREVVESQPLRVIEKPSELSPGQPGADGPAWEWNQMIPEVSSKLNHPAIDIENLMLSGCDLHTFDLKAQQQRRDLPLKS